ncbi:MAG: hypothetical protein ABIM50_05645 [Novosphingobium sp.]
MSDRLTISSAFSILMMTSYVLLGGDAIEAKLDEQFDHGPQVSVPSVLPQVSVLLAR